MLFLLLPSLLPTITVAEKGIKVLFVKSMVMNRVEQDCIFRSLFIEVAYENSVSGVKEVYPPG